MDKRQKPVVVAMLVMAASLNLINAATGLRYKDILLVVGFIAMLALSAWLLWVIRTNS